MDAARLVAEAERTMRGCPRPEDVLAQAWQACELTEAVGLVLAQGVQPGGEPPGEPGRRAKDPGSAAPGSAAGPEPDAEAGSSTGPGAPTDVPTGAGPPRTARLTVVRDAPATLQALRVLLTEIAHALVALTGSAEDESAYWQCIEALDAVDEARDRVLALARAAPG
jgi:hypothetical protein